MVAQRLHKPLQRPLLVHLIGAVRHVGVKVRLGVLGHNVADVFDEVVLLVPLLQVTEEPANREREEEEERMRRPVGTETTIAHHTPLQEQPAPCELHITAQRQDVHLPDITVQEGSRIDEGTPHFRNTKAHVFEAFRIYGT